MFSPFLRTDGFYGHNASFSNIWREISVAYFRFQFYAALRMHVYTHAIVKRYIENESNFTNAVKIQQKHIYLKNTYEKSLPHLSGSNELTVDSIPRYCQERISGWKHNITATS